MAKKYLGKNPLNTLMGMVLDVIPSKEIGDTDVTDMWEDINKPPKVIEVAPDGALSNWDYTLDDNNGTVTLNSYIGSETDVTVYGRYQIDGKEYDTKIGNNGSKYKGLFNNNNNPNCTNIKKITFNEGINTSECTNMSCMFQNCKLLTTINGLEYFDTSNVTDMSYMFNACLVLTSLNLRSFDTSKSIYMNSMFNCCEKIIQLDLRSFNTFKLQSTAGMFRDCLALTEVKVTSGKWTIPSGCNTTDMWQLSKLKSVTYYPAA